MKGTDLQFLSEIPLFADLSPDELAHVTTLFEEKRYKRGAILFFEEDAGNYMYVMKSGRVKVSRVLNQLQADGLIRVRARRFVVGDPEELLECGALVGHSVPSGTRAATL